MTNVLEILTVQFLLQSPPEYEVNLRNGPRECVEFATALQRLQSTNRDRSTGTRNSLEDEIAKVNFLTTTLYALQNTIDSYINSATDRRRYVLKHRFTKFSEITQCNGHYAVHFHSRSPILVTIESSYMTSY